jgi:hypothetical protein
VSEKDSNKNFRGRSFLHYCVGGLTGNAIFLFRNRFGFGAKIWVVAWWRDFLNWHILMEVLQAGWTAGFHCFTAGSWVNVNDIFFSDFRQFSAKKWRFFIQNQYYDPMFA